ncbi:hypothetical protein key_053 [Erwinia phage KEY]|uniref:Uncharacterized protein n=1 Tax=Erwinia phage KEY TaxID=2821255 RepID=A0AAE7WBL4_9CAUD|nr:hypothetical protein key_053 [Erwinia phage KEY]
MAVVHLHRPTTIHRKSMSAANMLCRSYPNNVPMHQLIWAIISKSPNKEFGFAELHVAIEALKYRMETARKPGRTTNLILE